MKIKAYCENNEPFEDTLTKGKFYDIITICPSGTGVEIENDKGKRTWHGTTILRIVEVTDEAA